MPATFISEPLTPDASFDPLAMSLGEPGLPAKFRWRERELIVAEVLETSRAYGDCKHGSGAGCDGRRKGEGQASAGADR